MKLWSERDFDECCYPLDGLGRATIVCGWPASGAYCPAHREQMDAAWLGNSSNARSRSQAQARAAKRRAYG